jgi:sugar phosphate isomerase/epimerase
MQTAVATVSLPGPLDEKLAAIAAAGFRGIEIFENDLLSFNGTPAEVANRFHRSRRGKGAMMPAGGKRFGM